MTSGIENGDDLHDIVCHHGHGSTCGECRGHGSWTNVIHHSSIVHHMQHVGTLNATHGYIPTHHHHPHARTQVNEREMAQRVTKMKRMKGSEEQRDDACVLVAFVVCVFCRCVRVCSESRIKDDVIKN